MTDLYKTLGVRRNASKRTIKNAYRKAALKHHPDRNPGDADAQARFETIKLAYEVLSDDERRRHYDETGETDQAKKRELPGEVMEVVSLCLGEAMSKVVAQGQLPSQHAFVNLMLAVLNRLEEKVQTPRRAFAKVQTALKDALGRFTRTEGDNILDAMTRNHLAGVEAQLATCDAELANMHAAREIIRAHGFRKEEGRAPWMPWGKVPFDFSPLLGLPANSAQVAPGDSLP